MSTQVFVPSTDELTSELKVRAGSVVPLAALGSSKEVAAATAFKVLACTPGISVPLLASNTPSIASTFNNSLSIVTGVVSQDFAAMKYQLNLMSMNLQALAAAAKALLAAGTTIAIPNIQTAAAKALLAALEKQAVALVEDFVAQQVNAIINQITAMALDEIQKDIAPVMNALQAINSILGKTEADLVLVSSVFSSKDCPAKAELLSEIYFKARK